LLVLTVREPAWPGLVDFRTAWVPWGAEAAHGQNPYLPPAGEAPNFSNAINFGIVYVALLAAGSAVAGASGIAVLFAALAFLEVFVVYFVAREITKDKRLATWAFLLAFFLPISMLWEVREVQDEIITSLGILLVLL